VSRAVIRCALSAAAAVVLASCGHATRPYAPPTTEALLAHLGKRSQAVHSMRTSSPPKVDHMSKEGRVKTPVAMMIERPDRLRFDAESPMAGRLLASLVTDGVRFWLLDFEKGVLYEGNPEPCNVARLIEIEMPPAAVVDMLLGGAPLPAGLSPELEWDGEHRRERLSFKLPDGHVEEVSLDGEGSPPRWDVVLAELKTAGGQVVWRLSHEGFSDVGGVRLPKVTRFEKPAEKADVIVRWKSGREVNVALPADAFQVQAPAGLPKKKLVCP